MISDNVVKAKIDTSEEVLMKSFHRLLALKHGKGDIEDAILYFQPELAECLYSLMLFYRELKAEARQSVKNKAQFNENEFRLLMAQNQRYSNAVKEVIKIGKSLGDAFAWFFYRDNLSELDRHFQHESTGLFVSGIGGRGEVEFIKNQQNFYGLFTLYHGITTMLRVGDFSLYAFDTGVVGIGELKTRLVESSENLLNIEAHISSKIDFNAANNIPKENSYIVLSPNQTINSQHLKDQLSVQDKVLLKNRADKYKNQYGSFDYDLINQAANNNGIALNDDKTLLLLGVRSSCRTLFQTLTTKEEHFDIPEEYGACAKMLVHPDAEYNQIIMSQIDTGMVHSRIPVFWWKINDEVCEDIYFKRLVIATAYNPCRLIQHFTDLGYSAFETYDHCFRLVYTDEKSRSELCNFEMYFDLVSHSLLKTQSVISMVESAINELKAGDYGSSARMDVNIQLQNFGGMPE